MQKIIHCDADCFYAAIEIRDDPSLRGLPVAVGGRSERRGVLTTCNYEARKYGVHSAMPTAHALRLCPDLVVVRGNMAKYKAASQIMRTIFAEYTDDVEPLSLDEAYLDVTQCEQHQGSATLIAQDIRAKVFERLQITVSAGVAPNKFLAKIASDWQKPDGLTVIRPEQVDAFVRQLPVKKIHGVGKVTAEKLTRLGIQTCQDIRDYGETPLVQRFGRFGLRLWQLAHGEDDRKVKANRIRKSLSVEHTYEQDLLGFEACQKKLTGLLEELDARLARIDAHYTISKAFIKIKFNDFSHTTVERAGSTPCYDDCSAMLLEAIERQDLPVRLMGVGVRFHAHTPLDYVQLDLFENLMSTA